MNTIDQTQSAELTQGRYVMLALCFLIVLLDGLDTTSIAFVAPVMAGEWGLPGAAFTPTFVATSLGAVVGYMLSGKLVALAGLRRAALFAVPLFSLGTLATAWAWDVSSLSALRFISAIGLGATLPIAIAAGTAAFPARSKETITVIIASGLSAGGVVGGLMGGPLMASYGWQSVFIVGGIAPLLVLPFFLGILPSAAQEGAQTRAASLPSLFEGPLAVRTMLLWSFAFLIFLVTYALTFWVPTLLVELGIPPQKAPLGAAAFGMGGLLGNIIVMTLVPFFGINRLLMATTFIAMALVIVTSQIDQQSLLIFVLIGGLGATLITGCVGQVALAVSQYGQDQRITGIGWAAASGRIGAIVGPAVGGILLALGYRAQEILLTALLPAALAIIVLVLIAARR